MKGYNPKRALGHWKGAKRRERWPNPIHWINHLIPPLARAICAEKDWDGFQFMGPAGLCCRIWISFINDGKLVYTLQVCSPDLETGTFCVTDCKTNTGEYPPNSVGAINGMNNPSVKIEPEWTVDKVLKYGYPPDDDPDDDIDTGRKVWRAA